MERVEVKIHSKSHIEAIFRVGLEEGKKQGYSIKYYIFSPSSLKMIDSERKGDRILKRFSLYGRFSSPRISFYDLVSSDIDSPLSVINRAYDRIVKGEWNANWEKKVITELRLLVNIFRWNFTTFGFSAKENKKISILEGGYKKANIFVNEYVDISTKAVALFRDVAFKFRVFNLSDEIKTAFNWTEEAISLEYEATTLSIYSSLQEGLSDDLRTSLINIIQEEQKHRENDVFLFRKTKEEETYQRHRLKKWFQSVLYLQSIKSKLPERLSQVFASTAAAVAMTFALFATFFAEQNFLHSSMQWALVTVIAYVFKDRIKEWLRKFLESRIPTLMSNNISFFYSPNTGKKVCTNRLSANVKKASDIPKSIIDKRREGSSPFYDMLPEEDVVIVEHYLTTPKKKKKFKEKNYSNYLTMIFRSRMDEYTLEMDNVEEMSFKLENSKLSVGEITTERLYHIHLVVEAKDKKETKLSHYLISMTKEGIVDLQKIS